MLRKIFSSFLCLVLLNQVVPSCATGPSFPIVDMARVVGVSPRIATVTDAYAGKSTARLPEFVVIQDLHANPFVQRRIAEAIEKLFQRWSIHKVFVEGAFGRVDISLIRTLPNKKRRQLTEDLLNQGYLSGPELAAIQVRDSWLFNSGLSPLKMVGLEDPELFWRQLTAYKNTRAFETGALHELEAIGQLQNALKLRDDNPFVQQLNRTKKLVRLELTPDDYKAYIENKNDTPETKILKPAMAAAEHFYQLAKRRDRVMLQNALASQDPSREPVLMIVGGFHAQGITDQLRKEERSFVVLTPNVEKLGFEHLYQDRMKESIGTAQIIRPWIESGLPYGRAFRAKVRRERVAPYYRAVRASRSLLAEWIGKHRTWLMAGSSVIGLTLLILPLLSSNEYQAKALVISLLTPVIFGVFFSSPASSTPSALLGMSAPKGSSMAGPSSVYSSGASSTKEHKKIPLSMKEFVVDLHRGLIQQFPEQGFSLRELRRFTEFVEGEWGLHGLKAVPIGLRNIYKKQLPPAQQHEFDDWSLRSLGELAQNSGVEIPIPRSIDDAVAAVLPSAIPIDRRQKMVHDRASLDQLFSTTLPFMPELVLLVLLNDEDTTFLRSICDLVTPEDISKLSDTQKEQFIRLIFSSQLIPIPWSPPVLSMLQKVGKQFSSEQLEPALTWALDKLDQPGWMLRADAFIVLGAIKDQLSEEQKERVIAWLLQPKGGLQSSIPEIKTMATEILELIAPNLHAVQGLKDWILGANTGLQDSEPKRRHAAFVALQSVEPILSEKESNSLRDWTLGEKSGLRSRRAQDRQMAPYVIKALMSKLNTVQRQALSQWVFGLSGLHDDRADVREAAAMVLESILPSLSEEEREQTVRWLVASDAGIEEVKVNIRGSALRILKNLMPQLKSKQQHDIVSVFITPNRGFRHSSKDVRGILAKSMADLADDLDDTQKSRLVTWLLTSQDGLLDVSATRFVPNMVLDSLAPSLTEAQLQRILEWLTADDEGLRDSQWRVRRLAGIAAKTIIPYLSNIQKEYFCDWLIGRDGGFLINPNAIRRRMAAPLMAALAADFNASQRQISQTWLFNSGSGIQDVDKLTREAAQSIAGEFQVNLFHDEIVARATQLNRLLTADLSQLPSAAGHGVRWRERPESENAKATRALMERANAFANPLELLLPPDMPEKIREGGLTQWSSLLNEFLLLLTQYSGLRPLLLNALQSKDEIIRIRAWWAVSQMKDEIPEEILTLLFQSGFGLDDPEKSWVQPQAVSALLSFIPRFQGPWKKKADDWMAMHPSDARSIRDPLIRRADPSLMTPPTVGNYKRMNLDQAIEFIFGPEGELKSKENNVQNQVGGLLMTRAAAIPVEYLPQVFDWMTDSKDGYGLSNHSTESYAIRTFGTIFPRLDLSTRKKAFQWIMNELNQTQFYRQAAQMLAEITKYLDEDEKMVAEEWLQGPHGFQNQSLMDFEFAEGIYFQLHEQGIRAYLYQLSQNMGTSIEAGSEESKAAGVEKTESIEHLLEVGDAAFTPAPLWGNRSSDAPNVALVGTHDEMVHITKERAESGDKRGPPMFAVASRPFLALLESLLFAVKYNHAILLEGETALGKSFAVRTLAALLGVPLRSLNVHPAITPDELIGALQPNPNRGRPGHPDTDKILVFKEGHLVEAMEKGQWLVLEELNMASTAALELLNFYLSHGKAYVQRNGKIEEVKIHDRFRLFATQNPKHYAGRQELSRAFLSRWVHWRIPEDAHAEEEHLTALLMVLKGLPNETALPLVQMHQAITGASKSWTQGWAASDPYEFNQRHLLRLIDWLERQEGAGKLLSSGKSLENFTPEERKQLALGLLDTYGLALREPTHRANLYGLLKDPLGLDNLGIHSEQDLEKLWLDQLLEGQEDTNENLRTWTQDKLKDFGTPIDSIDDHDLQETLKAMIPGKDHALPLVTSQRRVLRAMVEGLVSGDHLALVGPWAAGKTSLVFALYEMMQKPLFYFNLHEHRSLDELIGLPEPTADGQFEYKWGPLVQAMLSGSALFIDEPNLSELPEWLNTVMDTGELTLPGPMKDGRTVIKAKAGFRIITAMNPPKVKGRKALSPALKSRSKEIWVDEISDPKELEEIARHKLGSLSDQEIKHTDKDQNETKFQLAPFLVQLHQELKNKFPEQGYSLREFMRLTEFVLGEVTNLGPLGISVGLMRFYGKQLIPEKHSDFKEWLTERLGDWTAVLHPNSKQYLSADEVLADLLPDDAPDMVKKRILNGSSPRLAGYLISAMPADLSLWPILETAIHHPAKEVREAALKKISELNEPLPANLLQELIHFKDDNPKISIEKDIALATLARTQNEDFRNTVRILFAKQIANTELTLPLAVFFPYLDVSDQQKLLSKLKVFFAKDILSDDNRIAREFALKAVDHLTDISSIEHWLIREGLKRPSRMEFYDAVEILRSYSARMSPVFKKDLFQTLVGKDSPLKHIGWGDFPTGLAYLDGSIATMTDEERDDSLAPLFERGSPLFGEKNSGDFYGTSKTLGRHYSDLGKWKAAFRTWLFGTDGLQTSGNILGQVGALVAAFPQLELDARAEAMSWLLGGPSQKTGIYDPRVIAHPMSLKDLDTLVPLLSDQERNAIEQQFLKQFPDLNTDRATQMKVDHFYVTLNAKTISMRAAEVSGHLAISLKNTSESNQILENIKHTIGSWWIGGISAASEKVLPLPKSIKETLEQIRPAGLSKEIELVDPVSEDPNTLGTALLYKLLEIPALAPYFTRYVAAITSKNDLSKEYLKDIVLFASLKNTARLRIPFTDDELNSFLSINTGTLMRQDLWLQIAADIFPQESLDGQKAILKAVERQSFDQSARPAADKIYSVAALYAKDQLMQQQSFNWLSFDSRARILAMQFDSLPSDQVDALWRAVSGSFSDSDSEKTIFRGMNKPDASVFAWHILAYRYKQLTSAQQETLRTLATHGNKSPMYTGVNSYSFGALSVCVQGYAQLSHEKQVAFLQWVREQLSPRSWNWSVFSLTIRPFLPDLYRMFPELRDNIVRSFVRSWDTIDADETELRNFLSVLSNAEKEELKLGIQSLFGKHEFVSYPQSFVLSFLFQDDIAKNVANLATHLEKDIRSNPPGLEPMADKGSLGLAYFTAPTTWDLRSSDAPDIALVGSHNEVVKITKERAESNDKSGPPAFAVASRPFLSLLESLLFAVKYNHAILLEGETALGKSFAVRTLAALLGVPLRSLNVHPAITPDELIGALQPNPNRGQPGHPDTDKILVFKEGHLVEAMEKGQWLVLEELNMASTAALELLNFYLSHGKAYVQRNGKIEEVKIHDRFRLFATQNPKHYAGRQELSRAFLSRWVHWRIPEDAHAEEEHLTALLMVLKGLPNETALPLVQLHQAITGASKSWTQGWAASDPYEFNQRHLLRLIDWLQRQEGAGKLLSSGKSLEQFTPEERKQLALGLWDTYGLALREPEHRANLYGLLKDPLALDSLGIHSEQDLEKLWLDQLLEGQEDTNENLRTWAQEKLKGFGTDIDSIDDHDLKETLKTMIPGKDHALPLVKSQRRVVRAMVEGLISGDHLALVGPWAAGKTSLVFTLYEMMQKPLFYFNLHEHRSLDELIGLPEPTADGQFEYKWGPLVQAMLSGSALFIDEPNLSELPEWLNTVMDTGELTLPGPMKDGRTVIKAKAGFRIITAMNPPKVKGRKALSPALKSRSKEIWIDEISDPKELEEIARHKLGSLSDQEITHTDNDKNETKFQLAPFLVKLYQEVKNKFPEQGYSLREFMRLAEFVLGEVTNLGPLGISVGLMRFYGMQLIPERHPEFKDWLIERLGDPASLINPKTQNSIPSIESVFEQILPDEISGQLRRNFVNGKTLIPDELFQKIAESHALFPILLIRLRDPLRSVRDQAWCAVLNLKRPLSDDEIRYLSQILLEDKLGLFDFDPIVTHVVANVWSKIEDRLPEAVIRKGIVWALDSPMGLKNENRKTAAQILLTSSWQHFSKDQKKQLWVWLHSENGGLNSHFQEEEAAAAYLLTNFYRYPKSEEDKAATIEWFLGPKGFFSSSYFYRQASFSILRDIYPLLSLQQRRRVQNWVFGDTGLNAFGDEKLVLLKSLHDSLDPEFSAKLYEWFFQDFGGFRSSHRELSDEAFRQLIKLYPQLPQKIQEKVRGISFTDETPPAMYFRNPQRSELELLATTFPDLSFARKQAVLKWLFGEDTGINYHKPRDMQAAVRFMGLLYPHLDKNDQNKIIEWLLGPRTGLDYFTEAVRHASVEAYLNVSNAEVDLRVTKVEDLFNRSLKDHSDSEQTKIVQGWYGHWRVGNSAVRDGTFNEGKIDLQKLASSPKDLLSTLAADEEHAEAMRRYSSGQLTMDVVSFLGTDPRLENLILALLNSNDAFVRCGAVEAASRLEKCPEQFIGWIFGDSTGLEDPNDVEGHYIRREAVFAIENIFKNQTYSRNKLRERIAGWLKTHQDLNDDPFSDPDTMHLKQFALSIGIPDVNFRSPLQFLELTETGGDIPFMPATVEAFWPKLSLKQKIQIRFDCWHVLKRDLNGEVDPNTVLEAAEMLSLFLSWGDPGTFRLKKSLEKWVIHAKLQQDDLIEPYAWNIDILLNPDPMESRVHQLADELSQRLDEKPLLSSALTTSASEDHLGLAVFDLPLTWGSRSLDAPDVALVGSHDEVIKITKDRVESGDKRGPPMFAVASRPFLSLLESLLFAVKYNHAILLEGETALGKSFAVRTLAALLGVPLRSLNVHPAITPDELIGALQPNPNRGQPGHPDTDKILVFKEGHLVEAMEKGQWLVLEELNMASTAALELLNFYLSHGKAYVQRNGKIEEVKIHHRFRLFATQNPKHYAGRQELSRAFLSRWVHWRIPEDAHAEEEHLTALLMVLKGLPNETALPLVQIHQAITGASKSWTQGWAASDPYEFNQRHLLRLIDWLERQEGAGKLLSSGKSLENFAPEERKQLALGLWDTYGLALREPAHRANLYGLLKDPLALDSLGIHSEQDLEKLWLDQLLEGQEDTNENLQTWTQEKLKDFGTPIDSIDDHDLQETLKAMIPGKDHVLPLVKSQRRVIRAMVEGLISGDHLALVGPWAAGKTSLVFALYEMMQKPLFYFNLHEHRSLDELIGLPEPTAEGQFEYKWGPLVQAILSGSALFIDEPNLSELPEWLNTVMDTGELTLPGPMKDGRTVIKAKAGFRIITAMNPPKVKGRKALSPALKSRSKEIWVNEMTERSELISVVAHSLGGLADVIVSVIAVPFSRVFPETPSTPPTASFVQAPSQTSSPAPSTGVSSKQIIPGPTPTVTVVQPPMMERQSHSELQPGPAVIPSKEQLRAETPADRPSEIQADSEEQQHYLSQRERIEKFARSQWGGRPEYREKLTQLLTAVDRLKGYVHALGVLMGGDKNLTLEEGDHWAHDLRRNTLIYPLKDLLEHSADYIRGVAMHEGSHRDISRFRPDDPLYTEFFETETNRLLLNVIEDPRVNNNVDKRFPGRGMLNALYEAEWPEDMGQHHASEAGKGLLTEFGVPNPQASAADQTQMLPHIQYANGIIYLWRHHKIADFVTDPDAKAMLETHQEVLKQMFEMLPPETEVQMPSGTTYRISPSEIAKIQTMDHLIQQIHKDIFPDYKRLIEKSRQEIEQMMKNGQITMDPSGKPQSGSQGISIPNELIPDKIRQMMEDQAGKMNKRLDPKLNPPKYEEAKRAGQEAAERKQKGQPSTPAAPGQSKPFKAPKTYGDLLIQNIETARTAAAQRGRFETYLHPVMDAAAHLRSRIENVFYPNSRMRRVGWFRRGTPDPRKVMQSVARGFRHPSDLYMFTQKVLPTKRNFNVAFVIDHSGSMSGAKAEAAKRLLALLTYAFEDLVPSSTYGFSDSVSRYVDSADRLSDQEKDRLMESVDLAYAAGGGTNLPAAIALTAKELAATDGERKFLFVITDGESTHGSYQEVIDEARKEGIEVIGIGLGPGMEEVLKHFDHSVHVQDIDELPEKMSQLLEDLLLGDLSDSRDVIAYSSLKNTVAYSTNMLWVGTALSATKFIGGLFFGASIFPWALPILVIGLSIAGFLHSRDIRRTGRSIIATTTGGQTIFEEAYQKLTGWSQAIVSIEEAWHRLPLGTLARSEWMSKSSGILLSPIISLKSLIRARASLGAKALAEAA